MEHAFETIRVKHDAGAGGGPAGGKDGARGAAVKGEAAGTAVGVKRPSGAMEAEAEDKRPRA